MPHTAEYHVAAKFSQQICIMTGRDVRDQKEIHFEQNANDEGESWPPMTIIIVVGVRGVCCHTKDMYENLDTCQCVRA